MLDCVLKSSSVEEHNTIKPCSMCPMIMQICMIVIEDWFSFSTWPTFLKEGGLMRRLDTERRVRPLLEEPGKLRNILIFLVFILPSALHRGDEADDS